MFKQMKNIQSKMAEIQADLANKTVEVSTGGGMVKITANGVNEILSVKVDEELINIRITSYNVCYTKLLRASQDGQKVAEFLDSLVP